MRLLILHLSLILCPLIAHANVEKTIFMGPKPFTNSYQYIDPIAPLHLDTLSPSDPSIRRQILATLQPTSDSWKHSEKWILLNDLENNQRYETRICWSATQPIGFDLSIYDHNFISRSQALNNSLYAHSIEGQVAGAYTNEPLRLDSGVDFSTINSFLFLHIVATADYFTTNQSLMQTGYWVEVDIILDPFAFNLLPKSLLRTGIYITVLAVGSWFLSAAVWHWLYSVAQLQNVEAKTGFFGQDQKKRD